MQHNNATPRIIIRRHARDRAAECCVPSQVLRHCIRSMSRDLETFAGILNGKGKVALMVRNGASPVIRHTGDIIEVVSVLRPGQRVIRQDTVEVWIKEDQNESSLSGRQGDLGVVEVCRHESLRRDRRTMVCHSLARRGTAYRRQLTPHYGQGTPTRKES